MESVLLGDNSPRFFHIYTSREQRNYLVLTEYLFECVCVGNSLKGRAPAFFWSGEQVCALYIIIKTVSLWNKDGTNLFPIVKYPGSLSFVISYNITTVYVVASWPSLYHSVETGAQETG